MLIGEAPKPQKLRRPREPRSAHRVVAFADVAGLDGAGRAARAGGLLPHPAGASTCSADARTLGGRILPGRSATVAALAAFPCPCTAVTWATRCHEAVARCGRCSPGGPMRLRVGIHAGIVLVYGTRLFGRNVAVACRLQQAAQPGETLVSASVREVLAGHGAGAVVCGEVPLKGTATRIAAYRVTEAPRLSLVPLDGAAGCGGPAARAAALV